MKRAEHTLASGLQVEVRPIGPRARLVIQGKVPRGLLGKLVETEGEDLDLRNLPENAVGRIVKALGDEGVDTLLDTSRDTRLELVCSCSRVKPAEEWVQLTPDNMDEFLDWAEFEELERLVRDRNAEVKNATAPLSKTGTSS